jgi:hypothetical protein
MKYKVRKKYATGGEIGSAIGSTVGLIPGIGPAVGPLASLAGGLIGGMFNKKPKTPINTVAGSNQGYRYGGKVKPLGGGAKKFVGPKHEQGGILIDEQGNPANQQEAIAEVEGGETMQNDYIFSDELMVPETDMTFADAHEMLIAEGASPEEIDELAQMQEQVKQSEGVADPSMGEQPMEQAMMEEGVMAKGGKLPKYGDGGNTNPDRIDRWLDRAESFFDPAPRTTNWNGVEMPIHEAGRGRMIMAGGRAAVRGAKTLRNVQRAHQLKNAQTVPYRANLSRNTTPNITNLGNTTAQNATRGRVHPPGTPTQPFNPPRISRPSAPSTGQAASRTPATQSTTPTPASTQPVTPQPAAPTPTTPQPTPQPFRNSQHFIDRQAALKAQKAQKAVEASNKIIAGILTGGTLAGLGGISYYNQNQTRPDSVTQSNQTFSTMADSTRTTPAVADTSRTQSYPDVRTQSRRAPRNEEDTKNSFYSGRQENEPTQSTTIANTQTTPNQQSRIANPNVSVEDYLNSIGKDGSRTNRNKIAKRLGIDNYTGTAAQNTRMLRELRQENSQQQDDAAVVPAQPTQTVRQPAQSTTSGGYADFFRGYSNARVVPSNTPPVTRSASTTPSVDEIIDDRSDPERSPYSRRNGGKLPKYNNGGGFNFWTNTADSPTPTIGNTSVTAKKNILNPSNIGLATQVGSRLGAAMFAPRPKATPRASFVPQSTTSPVFADARGRNAAGFTTAMRGGNSQAAYAQYLQGMSGIASQEAEFSRQSNLANEQMRMQTEEQNTSRLVADRDARNRFQAGRVNLISEAIQLPSLIAQKEEADKRNRDHQIRLAASRIPDPAEREKFIEENLYKYGGKLYKKGGKFVKYKRI